MSQLAVFTDVDDDGNRKIRWVDMDQVTMAEDASSYPGLDRYKDLVVLYLKGLSRPVPVLRHEWEAACALYVIDANDFTSEQ